MLPSAITSSTEAVDEMTTELNQLITPLSCRHYNSTKFDTESQAKSASMIHSELFSLFSTALAAAKSKTELALFEDLKDLSKKSQQLVDEGVNSITTKLNDQLFPGLKFPSISTKVNFSMQPVFFNPGIFFLNFSFEVIKPLLAIDSSKGVVSKTEKLTVQKQEIEAYPNISSHIFL